MSAPRDVDPHLSGPGNGDEDHDPTGVRALLAALPDPGPMPPELIHRINRSLAAEEGTRVHHSSHADGYAQLIDDDRLTADRGAEAPRSSSGAAAERQTGDGASVHPFTPRESAPGRPGPLRRLPSIAIAASVVVLAGAVVLGILATQLGLDGSASMDTAVQATMGGADAGSAADESAGGAEEESADAAESAPLSSPLDGAAAMSAAPVAFLSSGAVVTTANLAGHARAVRDGSTGVVDQSSRAVMAQSPVGTPEGAADCIGDLLDKPAADVATLLTVVDFVRYAGADAALILVREPEATGGGSGSSDADGEPGGAGEASTAYLVPVDCGSGPAVTLRAPVRLDS